MKKILVATDGSEHSAKAIREAISLAGAFKAEITVITVMDETPSFSYLIPPDIIGVIRERQHENSRKILARAEKDLHDHGIAAKTILASGRPADEICSEANKGNYDLVVLGSRGLGGISELFLGSVSNRVVHCVKPSVHVVK